MLACDLVVRVRWHRSSTGDDSCQISKHSRVAWSMEHVSLVESSSRTQGRRHGWTRSGRNPRCVVAAQGPHNQSHAVLPACLSRRSVDSLRRHWAGSQRMVFPQVRYLPIWWRRRSISSLAAQEEPAEEYRPKNVPGTRGTAPRYAPSVSPVAVTRLGPVVRGGSGRRLQTRLEEMMFTRACRLGVGGYVSEMSRCIPLPGLECAKPALRCSRHRDLERLSRAF